MNTVTAQEIVDAFNASGLVPVQGEMACERKGKACGCAITAIGLKLGWVKLDEVQHASYEAKLTLFNNSREYFGKVGERALWMGFDGLPARKEPETFNHPNYRAGHEAAQKLGLKIWCDPIDFAAE